MMTEAEIKTERAKLEARLDELDDIEQALASVTPVQQLANALHSAQCRLDHTDRCGWFYEMHKDVDDWRGETHKNWLAKAQRVEKSLPGKSIEEIIDVVRVVTG